MISKEHSMPTSTHTGPLDRQFDPERFDPKAVVFDAPERRLRQLFDAPE